MPKRIVVSIHDAAPNFTSELRAIVHSLAEMGVREKSLLVVPDFGGEFALTNHSEFADFMLAERERGAELGLHGLNHRNFEFLRCDYDWAKSALEQGIELFSSAFGFRPLGFVAPQWFQSKGSLKAISELDFLYTATFRTVRYSDGTEYKTLPLNFDWGNSLLDKTIAAINGWVASCRKSGLVRFAIHPMDIPNGVFEKEMAVLSSLLEAGWQPVTYEKLNPNR